MDISGTSVVIVLLCIMLFFPNRWTKLGLVGAGVSVMGVQAWNAGEMRWFAVVILLAALLVLHAHIRSPRRAGATQQP